MNLLYFDGPNVGDQLNPYLFGQLLANTAFQRPEGPLLCAIGTILDNRVPEDRPVVVFGSGVRDAARTFSTRNWDVRFLRGPISANVLGMPGRFITDPAYCLPLLPGFADRLAGAGKKYDLALVPYFSLSRRLAWRRIAKALGAQLIDPAWAPERFIEAVMQSRRVVTGAMHGAIIADICRVPWVRLRLDHSRTEPLLVSELKWCDWLASARLDPDRLLRPCLFDERAKPGAWTDWLGNFELFARLKRIRGNVFQLSSEAVLRDLVVRLEEQVEGLRRDYAVSPARPRVRLDVVV